MDCPICCDTTKKMVSCPKCEFEICHKCVINYAKSAKKENISCVSCKQVWDHTFICKSLPLSVVYGPLKEIREQILFDREKALLPATSEIYSRQLELGVLKMKITRLEEKLVKTSPQKMRDKLEALENEYDKIRQEIVELKQATGDLESKSDKKAVVIDIVCPCPASECKGFVIKKQSYKCNLCTSQICDKCYLLKEDEHECKSEDVETVNLIKKECKACPGCGTLSRKTEGCAQVWCLVCHKAWNWSTGVIETGRIHATDYYHYMRNNGLEIAPADECDINFVSISHEFDSYPSIFNDETVEFLTRLNTKRIEFMDDDYNPQPRPIDFLDLRIDYLSDYMTENEWKTMLYKKEKEQALLVEIHKIKLAYSYFVRDSMAILERTLKDQEEDLIKKSVDSIYEMHEMMEKEYKELTKIFKSTRKSPFRPPLPKKW